MLVSGPKQISPGLQGRLFSPVSSRVLSKMSPDNVLKLGMEMHKLGRMRDAVTCYFKTLDSEPSNPTALFNSCDIIFASKPHFRTNELIKYLEGALKLNPDHYGVRNELGFAYFITGRYENASRQFFHLLEKDLSSKGAKFHSTVLSNLGLSLAMLGNTGKAEEVLRSAVELDPKNIEASLKLTELSASSGPNGAINAIEAIDRSINTKPHNIIALSTKGDILFDEGRYREAAAVFMQCSKMEPGDPKHLKDLAASLTRIGRNFAAAKIYLKVAAHASERDDRVDDLVNAVNAMVGWIKSII